MAQKTGFVLNSIPGIRAFQCYYLDMRRAGFVLAGGQSSRMGRNKARLVWNSHLLIEHVASKVWNVAGNVALIGPPEQYSDLGLECLPDLHPGLGPLAGVESALASGRGELNLVVACDMPSLETVWLERLLNAAENTTAPCAVARDSEGILHPLCAVYRSTCLKPVRRAVTDGRLRLTEFVARLSPAVLDIPEPIRNVNTPAEWQRWQEQAADAE